MKLTAEQKGVIDRLSSVDNITTELRTLFESTTKNLEELRQMSGSLTTLIEQKSMCFPWLADAISQYHELLDLKVAEFLVHKLRPAVRSAERVREVAAEKRELRRKFILARNRVRYYEALFPWLSDFVDEDIDDLLIQVSAATQGSDEDPVRQYLAEGEYENLTQTERNQLALDRYWKKSKSSWEIGRDYERYVGYLYEQDGYDVEYKGIVAGLSDLGRDLVCRKGSSVEIVQCKRWRKERTIHEKHINQLFGTMVEYYIKERPRDGSSQLELFPGMVSSQHICGSFVTSGALSNTARDFAETLGIKVREGFSFVRYPSIKCNISRKKGAKIYHLPLDQQYDRTKIEEERNERYVETVAEAERLGFRRAWRWRGKSKPTK